MFNTQIPITPDMLHAALGVSYEVPSFDGIGDIFGANGNRLLSYIKDPKFLETLDKNAHIRGVLCTAEVSKQLSDRLIPLICDDPNWSYFTLIDYLAQRCFDHLPCDIQSPIPAGCHISDVAVHISKNVIIEGGVTIHKGCVIEEGSILRAGAVLGLDTFQHQRTSRGIVSPAHNGILRVGRDAEIGAHATISKGFSYRDTVIGSHTKMDAHAYVGHGTQIGGGSFICAGAKIMGHAKLGVDCYVGPNAVVSSRVVLGDGVRVSLGSIVTKDAGDKAHLSGNFAIPHSAFIANQKTLGTP